MNRAAWCCLVALLAALGCGGSAREQAGARSRKPGAACRVAATGDPWAQGALDAIDTGERDQVALGILALAEVREPERMIPCIDAAAVAMRARSATRASDDDAGARPVTELADLAVIEATQRMSGRLGPTRTAERLAPMLDASKGEAVRAVAARVIATEDVDASVVSAALGRALSQARDGSMEFFELFDAVWATGFASREARSAFEARVSDALAHPRTQTATMTALRGATAAPPPEVRRYLLQTIASSAEGSDRSACAVKVDWLLRTAMADASDGDKATIAACIREGGSAHDHVTTEEFARLVELRERSPSNVQRCTALDAWPRLVEFFDHPGIAGVHGLERCAWTRASPPFIADLITRAASTLQCEFEAFPEFCDGLSLYLMRRPEALSRVDLRRDESLAEMLLARLDEDGACRPEHEAIVRAMPLTPSLVARALRPRRSCLLRLRADEVADAACGFIRHDATVLSTGTFGALSRHRDATLPATSRCRGVAPSAAASLLSRAEEAPLDVVRWPLWPSRREPAPIPYAWRVQWPVIRTLHLATIEDPDRLALSLLNASITADESEVAPGLRFAARVLHRDRAHVAPLLTAFRNGALDTTTDDEAESRGRIEALAWLLTTRARGTREPLPVASGDRLSAQACNALSALFSDVVWRPEDLPKLDRYARVLRASTCSNPSQRARVVLGVRPALLRQKYLRAKLPALVGAAVGAFTLAWLALLIAWSRASIGAAFFWKPLLRRALGLGLVGAALTRLRPLSRLLLRPLRAGLTRGADLELFQAETFFRDLPLTATDAAGRSSAVTLNDLARAPAGRVIIEAPSGTGKTMLLRWLLRARPERPAVYLRARECAEGVLAAALACSTERCRDAKLFDALMSRGHLDVYIDGLNEADAETRARVIEYVQTHPRASIAVATQPFEHPVKRSLRVVQIGSLDEARVRAFLELQAASLCDDDEARARYKLACKEHVDRAVADAQTRSTPLPLRDVLPDNGWELGVLAQLLARGADPDVGALEEHLHDSVLDDFRAASGDDRDPFPEEALSDRALAALEGDRDALKAPDDPDASRIWTRALACLAALRLVVHAHGDAARWRFRHEQVAAFYASFRFIPGRSPGARERWKRHIAQTQFRSVYLALARRLPLRDALALGRVIQSDAAERNDPLLAGEYVRRLERRRARWDVCILHDTADADYAWTLHDAMRAGLRVFLEARRVTDPSRRAEVVARAVESSRLVAVVVSPASRTSFFARSELVEAFRAMREDPTSRRVTAVFRDRERLDLARLPSEILGVRAIEDGPVDAVSRALIAAVPSEGEDDEKPARYDRTHLHRALCAMVQGQFYAVVARCGVDPARVPGPAAPQATAANELLSVTEASGDDAMERLVHAIDEARQA